MVYRMFLTDAAPHHLICFIRETEPRKSLIERPEPAENARNLTTNGTGLLDNVGKHISTRHKVETLEQQKLQWQIRRLSSAPIIGQIRNPLLMLADTPAIVCIQCQTTSSTSRTRCATLDRCLRFGEQVSHHEDKKVNLGLRLDWTLFLDLLHYQAA